MTDGLIIFVIVGSVVLIFALPSLVRRSRRRAADPTPTPTPAVSVPLAYSDLVGTDKGLRFEKRLSVIDDTVPYDNAGPPPSIG